MTKKKVSKKAQNPALRKGAVSKSFFGGWINVTKRKPKVNQRVLCSHSKDKWVVAGHLATDGKWYNKFQDKYSDADIIVTHWALLPKPPKNVC